MSELFMECVEEELEPWQKRAPDVYTIDDDDDEPIFVGVISNERKNEKPAPPPPQKLTVTKKEIQAPQAPPPPPPVPPPPPPPPPPAPKQHQLQATSSVQVPLTMSVTANAKAAESPGVPAAPPRAVIVNNRGYIVTSSHLPNNSVIGSLGPQYPSGTPFAIVKAAVIPGVVHRPQVQQISNNIVTLSNVQSPAVYSLQPSPMQHNSFTSQPVQSFPVPTTPSSIITDQRLVKHGLPPQPTVIKEKKARRDLGSIKVVIPVENGSVKDKCRLCQEEFLSKDALKAHIVCCRAAESAAVKDSPYKHIMLLSEFYYGRVEGDVNRRGTEIGNMTFKCQSCLKVLKNNIRFMNHMKHHLELEKQNSESWDSHTTCQHCYRQYMTPYQLQCHVESAHSLVESSTNCKICELAFESEQVLLEHMRDNHKPGEMPYFCHVCNFRSSFFSEVETHFRTVHENTKEMLCPFCLRVLRSTHTYMNHFLRHQKKAIHRCGKCRLNFLTCKEKVEHRAHFHKTFRRPKALEGLAPGTKVTIRASLTGRPAVALPPPLQVSFSPGPGSKRAAGPCKGVKTLAAGKAKSTTNSKKKTRRITKHNLELQSLSVNGGQYTCIECKSKVDHFFSHYPMISSCGACKYRTSCKVSIGNHMIRCHSTITKNRFMKMDRWKLPSSAKLNLVCLTCNLSVIAANGDLMSKHLTEQPGHICKILHDKDFRAKDQVSLNPDQPSPLSPAPVLTDSMPEVSGSTVTEAQPEPNPEPVSPEGNEPEKTSPAEQVVAAPSEDELKPPSSPCAPDVAEGGCAEKEVEIVEVTEKLPVSDQDEVIEQQLSSE